MVRLLGLFEMANLEVWAPVYEIHVVAKRAARARRSAAPDAL
ncbi:hypothetical protein ACTMU2_06190 [Cupriavidus basilensis]